MISCKNSFIRVEKVIKEFVSEWSSDERVEGILLTGSYAIGVQNSNSDIDFRVLISKEYNEPKKITEKIDDFVYSYIIANATFYKSMLEQQHIGYYKQEARIFKIGKICYSSNDTLKNLKNKALKLFEKPFRELQVSEQEKLLYELYIYTDKFKQKHKRPYYSMEYFTTMVRVFEIYSMFLGYERFTDLTKLYNILNSAEYRILYHYKEFLDTDFMNLWNNAVNKLDFEAGIKVINYVRGKLDTTYMFREEYIIKPY